MVNYFSHFATKLSGSAHAYLIFVETLRIHVRDCTATADVPISA